MKRWQLSLVFLSLFFSASSLLAQPRPGLKPDPDTYTNRWAVIVGVNYDNEGAKSSGVSRLRFAEDDAKAVHELLIKNYGFKPENTPLLIGKDATKANIEAALESLRSQTRVTSDDCVLFYFSGHGFGKAGNKGTRGQLLCADAMLQDGQPTIGSVIELDSVVRNLMEDCKAKHKLLVLDCCYSATVFSEYVPSGRRANSLEVSNEDQNLYKLPGIQAMVASRANAQDGFSGHSPFTDALLKSLERMPTRRAKGATIRTSELFSQMKSYFADSLGRGQSPSCSWLSSDQGEFHFYPDPESKFPDPEVPNDDIRKMMVAMVPGSFGNWWFSETPWFMPGLRYYILEKDAEVRSIDLQMIASDQLEQAASRLRQRKAENTDERFVQRMKHLDLMLTTEGQAWNSAVRRIIADLTIVAEKESPDPLDVHYLAVLHHGSGQGDRAAAKRLYERALDLYAAKVETDKSCKSLQALCYADLGWYAYEVEADYQASCDNFVKARGVYGIETPQPFLIYVFCREADALSRLGRVGAARRRLEDAETAVSNSDPGQEFPLTAAYFHRRAWIDMDWCDFNSARERFTRSNLILSKEASRNSSEATILEFHNHHGEAMAIRFGGNRDEAMFEYRELLKTISLKLGELREDTANDLNYRQVRARMIERWVNTLERLGDCSLFGQPTDVVEAADDYRRAIRACTYLSPEMRARWEERLRYKYALTLALPNSSVQDLELAEEQIKVIEAIRTNAVTGAVHQTSTVKHQPPGISPSSDADSAHENPDSEEADEERPTGDLENETPVASTAPAQPKVTFEPKDRDIAICKMLTKLLILYCRSKDCPPGQQCEELITLAKETQAFRTTLQQHLEQHRLNPSLRRDEIEAALFCVKLLLHDLPNPAHDTDPKIAKQGRITRLNDIELLLGYCRLTRPRLTQPAAHGMAFLRPYYDCAIESLLELKPSNAKQLIEVAHEARNGKSHFKPLSDEATLVLYCTKQQGYLFLDIPRSTSTHFQLPPGVDLDALRIASKGSQPIYALPANIRVELQSLSMPVRICWDDPVRFNEQAMPSKNEENLTQLKQPQSTTPDLSSVEAAPTTLTFKPPTRIFPFILPAGTKKLEEAPTFSPSEIPVQPVVVREGE